MTTDGYLPPGTTERDIARHFQPVKLRCIACGLDWPAERVGEGGVCEECEEGENHFPDTGKMVGDELEWHRADEVAEKWAFEAFAMAHPHEAHAEWPERFWQFFHERHPEVGRQEMERVLSETDKEATK